jgi:hypothetical protein
MFSTFNAVGIQKKRYGNQHSDGGYVILDSPLGAKHLLGYGVGLDMTFENDLTEGWGINATVFDHTITDLPKLGPGVKYVPEGIGPRDDYPVCSLSTHVKKYVPEGGDYILKIDVEGAEWAVIETADFSRATQVIMEIHDLEVDNSRLIKKMNEKFYLIHIHGVNCHNQPYVYIDRCHKMPRYLECTWVRKDLVTVTPNSEIRPTPLDRVSRPEEGILDVTYDFLNKCTQPVSFVVNDGINLKIMKMLITDGDEIITTAESAKNDRIFIIQPGDIFPYRHVMSISEFQHSLAFPVSRNGLFNMELRFIVKGSDHLNHGQDAIFNVNSLQNYRT